MRPILEDRGRITELISIPVSVLRRQNQTEMFSDHDETSPSIAIVDVGVAKIPTRASRCNSLQSENHECIHAENHDGAAYPVVRLNMTIARAIGP